MSEGHLARLAELCREASADDDSLDVCGVVWLEHINLAVGSRQQAEAFYQDYLGFTPDPSSMLHFNLGRQQFHLQTDAPPMRVSGAIGVSLPDLDALRARAGGAAAALQGTLYEVLGDAPDAIRVRCPWGNQFYCMRGTPPPAETDAGGAEGEAPPRQPKIAARHAELDRCMAVVGGPGIRFVEVLVPRGKAAAAGRFYEHILGCSVRYSPLSGGTVAVISMGPTIHLCLSEGPDGAGVTEEQEQGMRGVHIAIYVSEFGRVYERLQSRNLVWTNPRFARLDTCGSWDEVRACRQFRFRHVVDPETKERIVELEHETRSLRHFQFGKHVHYSPP